MPFCLSYESVDTYTEAPVPKRQRRNVVVNEDGSIIKLSATSTFRHGLSSALSKDFSFLLQPLRDVVAANSIVKVAAASVLNVLVERWMQEIDVGCSDERLTSIKNALVEDDDSYRVLLHATAGLVGSEDSRYAWLYAEASAVIEELRATGVILDTTGYAELGIGRVLAYTGREMKKDVINATIENPGRRYRFRRWVTSIAKEHGGLGDDSPPLMYEMDEIVDTLYKPRRPIFRTSRGQPVPAAREAVLDVIFDECKRLAPQPLQITPDGTGGFDLVFDPWALLRFWHGARSTVVTADIKCFNLLPSYSSKEHFATIDDSAARSIISNFAKSSSTRRAALPKIAKDVYAIFDTRKMRKLLRPSDTRKTGATFRTDGVQLHASITHLPVLTGKKFAMTNIEHDDPRLDIDRFEIVGIDPGRNSIVTAHNYDAPPGHPRCDYAISRGEWRHLRGSSAAALRLNQLKLGTFDGRAALEAEQSIAANSTKTVIGPSDMLAAVATRLREAPALRRFYGSRAATRRRFDLDMRKQKAMDVVSNRLLKPVDPSKRVVLAYGNASFGGSGIKGIAPGPVKIIKDHIMRKHGEVLVLIDEYRTSQTCSRCLSGPLATVSCHGRDRVNRNAWGLKLCKSCGELRSRDQNSAVNMAILLAERRAGVMDRPGFLARN
jgi:hypothetical protein